MLKKICTIGLAGAALVALAACNQNTPAGVASSGAPVTDNSQAAQTLPAAPDASQTAAAQPGNNETVSAVKDAVAGAAGAVSAELTTSAQGFAQSAAMGDMYEIEAGQIALMRSHSNDVKQIAQRMIDDHTATSNQLKATLMQANANIALPAALDARHQGLINDLNGAKDQDFDTRYLAQQDNAHNEAILLMRGYADKGDNPALQTFAQSTLPKIQMHLDMIKMAENAHDAVTAQNR